ncbi:MAG: hypothetical protein RIC95_09935 [Vicingaceae bacterium]
MKKLLLILSIIISTSTAFAQTNLYHSFPDSNVVWNFNLQHYCFSIGGANEDYSITITGDTMISNQTYQKVETPYVQSNVSGNCNVYTSGYKGAIREDIGAKKVYFMPPNQNVEELLYDFSLQVGDSLKGYLEGGQNPTIVAIDSVLVGNSYRKRWMIDTNKFYPTYIIEGIGSTFGLLHQITLKIANFPNYRLNCFQHG